MKMGWDVRIDDIAHKLPFLPKNLKHRVCDWLDRRLGVTEEELVRVNAGEEEDWYTEYQWERYKKGMGQ